jgi:nitrogen fixation NifU-like protein
MYPAKVLARCQGGPHAGSLPAADPDVGTGAARAPAHGDIVRIQVRADAAGLIREARFKSFGCGWTIASASFAAEWMEGRTAVEVKGLSEADIALELELPPDKAHCALLAVQAVRAALDDLALKTGSEFFYNGDGRDDLIR